MNKVILFILMITLFVTACTNNAHNVGESSTDNSSEKKVDTKQELIEDANIIFEIDRTEYLTGEIITDGDYEISSSGFSTICFVPDKESRKIIEEKYSTYDLYYIDDESYCLYYNNVSIVENLPSTLGIYKVKVKFDLNNIYNYNRFKLNDIELTDNIGTIFYEGKSYKTNNLDLDVKVKDRVCGLIVSFVDRLGEYGLRVGFCGVIETEGYYNINYSEMDDRNYGYIYYDKKYKDNIPMIMGENSNKDLFYFVDKENMFEELVNYSSFGRGKFKTSNYDLVYNFGMGRAPSDILTEIVSLDENFKNMFEVKDISTTNIMGYTDDFAIVSSETKYDNNAELYDYYYINKNNPEKIYLFSNKDYYKLKEVINEKEFKLITEGRPIDTADEIKCKITDKGVDISYSANNSGEMEIDNNYINKFNISAINDNSNQIATDGKFIYYIDIKTRYINRVQIDGSNNETISEHKCSKIFCYKGKLYFLEYTQLNSWIACIDMDGSNYEIIYEHTMVNDFIIHDEVIYMTAFVEEQEVGFAFGFYKYNLSDGVLETFDDSIAIPSSPFGLCLINNKIYYNINYKTREYDISANTVKEYDISIRDMQEYNNNYYSYSNTYISRHKIDNIIKFDKIYEIDDDYIIKRISVIDDLIFFTYAYDYTKRDEKVIFVDVINLDGSNHRSIFQFEYSTLGHYDFDKIYVVNDKLFVISTDSQYPLFKVFDYEGNELWVLY